MEWIICVVRQLAVADCSEGHQFTIYSDLIILLSLSDLFICQHFWFFIFLPQLSLKFLWTELILLISADFLSITLNLININTETSFRVRYAVSPTRNWLADGFSGRHMNCTRRANKILRLSLTWEKTREHNVWKENSWSAKTRRRESQGAEGKFLQASLREC